jgi:hypothetical protein
VRHDHDGRRACDAFEVVVLGDPVAQVAAALGELRERARVGERFRNAAAFRIGDEVENGELQGSEPFFVQKGDRSDQGVLLNSDLSPF